MNTKSILSLACSLCLSVGTWAADRVTAYTYTPEGLVATIDGPRVDVGDVTTYQYYPNGNRHYMIDALGHVTEFTDYDAAGRLLRMVDPNGLVSSFTYHPRGWLATSTVGEGPGALTTIYTYDPAGNLERVTQPSGEYLDFTYDAANRLTDITDALGNVMHYDLDAMGNRVLEEARNPYAAFSLTRVYNDLNRLQYKIESWYSRTDYGYDAQGNMTSIIDGNNRPTMQQFDALDRMTRTIDRALGVTEYGYDARDNLESVTDPNGGVTAYDYDGLDNQTEIDSPDTGLTTFTHDEAGNVTTRTDAKDQVFAYTYDALNRLTFVDAPGNADDVAYTYDTCTHGIGRLCEVARGTTVLSYTYTLRGELDSLTQTVATSAGNDQAVAVLQYGYDAFGRLASMTYPSGAQVDYHYDAAGRVDGLDLTVGGNTTSLISNAHYQPFGPLADAIWGNGLAFSAMYYTDYQLMTEGSYNFWEYLSQPDGNGNPHWVYMNVDNGDTMVQELFYDSLDRLDTVSTYYSFDPDYDYDYDAVGNRTSLTADLVLTGYTYDLASNRLNGIDTEIVSTDANGNTTFLHGMTLQYTTDNRLAVVVGHLYSTYNGLGERVAKETDIPGLSGDVHDTRVFVYDQGGQLVAETGPGGQVLREYVYFDGRPIGVLDRTPTSAELFLRADLDGDGAITYRDEAEWSAFHAADPAYEITGDGINDAADAQAMSDCVALGNCVASTFGHQLYYVHADRQGTPRALSDETGDVKWLATYTPFGQAEVTEDPDGNGQDVVLNLRFPGQYYDAETGLHYNYFRDYDPSTGRYIQSDPIGLDGGLNTYLYGNANPLRYVDPTGETPAYAARGAWWVGSRAGAAFNAAFEAAVGVSVGKWIYDATHESDNDPYLMPAKGNVADTEIARDYGEAASESRQCGGEPPDRCEWLNANKHKYRPDQVKRTQKAWGCRRSRHR